MQARTTHLKCYHAFMHDVVRVAEPGAVFDVLLERQSTNKPYKLLTRVQMRVLGVTKSTKCSKEHGCCVEFQIEPLDLGYALPCNRIRYTHRTIMRHNHRVSRQTTSLFHNTRRLDIVMPITPVASVAAAGGTRDDVKIYRMLHLSDLEEARMKIEMEQLRAERDARKALWREKMDPRLTPNERFHAWKQFIKEHKLDFFRKERFDVHWAKKKATRNMILNIMYDTVPSPLLQERRQEGVLARM